MPWRPGMPPSAAWKAWRWGAAWILMNFVSLFAIANCFLQIWNPKDLLLQSWLKWCVDAMACPSCGMQPLRKRYLFQSSALKLPKAHSTTENIEEWCNDCLNCGWNHPTTASKQALNFFCFGFGASHVLDVSEAVCCREPQPRWGELKWFFGSGLRLTRLTLGRGTIFFHLDLSRSPAVPTIDLPNWECYESYDLSPSQQVSEFLLQKLDAYEIPNNPTCKLHYQYYQLTPKMA